MKKILLILSAILLFLLLSGCGQEKKERGDCPLQKYTRTIDSRSISDQDIYLFFHPEILAFTVPDTDENGKVISSKDYVQCTVEAGEYYRSLYKQYRPVPVDGKPAEVTKVIDGNTIQALIDGREETVRLIGTISSQDCASPAADQLNNLVGLSVVIESDPSVGDRDDTGRLLRYVWSDERDIVFDLIGKGLVKANSGIEYKYKAQYGRAEALAMNSGDGLWDPAGCNEQYP